MIDQLQDIHLDIGVELYNHVLKRNGVIHSKPRRNSDHINVKMEGNSSSQYYPKHHFYPIKDGKPVMPDGQLGNGIAVTTSHVLPPPLPQETKPVLRELIRVNQTYEFTYCGKDENMERVVNIICNTGYEGAFRVFRKWYEDNYKVNVEARIFNVRKLKVVTVADMLSRV